ncbi:MAG: Glycerate dehydrogenase [Alphaproteobacteria bacterium MarineAlpha9_Bin4]|nr:D-glycerate dehydrogenase [Pelagibacterales bacterium]PPR27230.1 MAG: Glycerate dehydrogenase [Alphaproteobacteria bacterium MarineAlpha9_Bin4]|tara:strand:- start:1001 stop:1975 length:975 start_codon:yes stop_codon:yes gene_type:complete
MIVKKPKVFITRKLPVKIETRMMELFDTTLNEADVLLSEDQLIEVFKKYEIIVPSIADKITTKVLEKASENLKLIANFGAGIDHIDLEAAKSKNIIVTNSPGLLADDTADLIMSLLLALPRRLYEGSKLVAAGNWNGWSPTKMLGKRIYGKRLGIIGLGRIGQAVAKRAKVFGLAIHYHSRNQLPTNIEDLYEATYWNSLDEMIKRMDIISVNCPLTKETKGLMSEKRLRLMTPDAYIINTSRSEIIDEKALFDLLKNNKIAGAGLDVFRRQENGNSKLLEAPNTILIPHLGSATIEGRIEMGEKVIVNIKTFIDGHNPPNRII